MEASVLSFENFLDFDNPLQEDFYNREIKKYCIPKYQREYKWEAEKIKVLLANIYDRDKFLGIITLDEKLDRYEIVDGQQRLTTLYLLLVELYNYYWDENCQNNYDQMEILYKIKPEDFILENETVGAFLFENIEERKIDLSINASNDIYRQLNNFEIAISTIRDFLDCKFLNGMTGEIDKHLIDSYYSKILKCKILVLINKSIVENESTEEIYVDINQKAQVLDVEDIFKGNCFQIVNMRFHESLKDKWIKMKQNGFVFLENFGYDDFNNFLYIYFLSECRNPKFTEKLQLNGEYVLDKKTSNAVMIILDNILEYSTNIIAFYTSINQMSYNFTDLTIDSHAYLSDNSYDTLKLISKKIMTHSNKYQKLPFFTFINYIYNEKKEGNKANYRDFKKVITQYYIYYLIFVKMLKSKKKEVILFEHMDFIRNVRLENFNDSIISIKRDLKRKYKDLLKDKELIALNKKHDASISYDFYSIIDNYNSNNEEIDLLYSFNGGYDDEHFIIHEKNKVVWQVDEKKVIFSISECKEFKGTTINRLILKKELNGKIKSFDIVTKIEMIKAYYDQKTEEIPNHIKFYISQVEKVDEYHALIELKNKKIDDVSEIKSKYIKFINNYFDDYQENHSKIINELFELFVVSLQ